MKKLKAFLSIFKIKTAESFQYRLAGLAGASTSIVYALIEIIVFIVFYTYAERSYEGMARMTLRQVISYAWLAQVLYTIQPMTIDSEILKKITSGDVGIELCRPLDLYYHWFAKTAANRITPLLWRGSVVLLAAVLMPFGYGLAVPHSIEGLILSVISLLMAILLCTSYGMLMYVIRLNISWGEGPTYILMLIGGVLSGGLLPLQLWPNFLQKILLYQPFAGYMDIPLRLYIGTAEPKEGGLLIALQLIWSIVFILAGKRIMNRKLTQIVVQGG